MWTADPLLPESNCNEEDVCPTAVELLLPWKRNTGREPMSSVETHTMPDESCPVRSEVPTWVSDISDNASSYCSDTNEPEFVPSEAYLPKENGYGDAEPELDTNALPDIIGPSPKTTRSYGDSIETAANLDLGDHNSDTIPPPWRTAKPNSESQLNRTFMSDWLDIDADQCCMENGGGALDSEAAQQNCTSNAPFPWRDFSGNDRVVPDQHAPRRPPIQSRATELGGSDVACCSSSHSWADCVSMQPQMSCQSFRMSEAESRHSEPFHLQHVIDMTPPTATHWLPSFFAHETDDPSGEILQSLEQVDSKKRIFQWLNDLDENSLSDLVETNETCES